MAKKSIAEVIPGMGIHCGGPSRSVLNLAQGLRMLDVNATIITNDDPTDPLISKESWIDAVPYKKNAFGYNHAFKRELEKVNTDLFHVHSVYSYSSTIAMRVAQKRGTPYVVSPRGSLLKTALTMSSQRLKAFFNRFILIPDMNKAAAIHATSYEEMNDLFALGVRRPIILIPNSIPMPPVVPVVKESVFRVGVCGRINPMKNIDGIIRAWSISGLNRAKAELVIIGGTRLDKEVSYLADLHKLENHLGISNIIWAGPQYGEVQQRLLRSLSVLVLGSHSENFGMVVPEALALGIPVIASKGTPWEDLVKTCSGWWIDNADESISKTLQEAYDLFLNNQEALKQMGRNGRRLVAECYSQEAVAKKWERAYEWILGDKNVPEFVTENSMK